MLFKALLAVVLPMIVAVPHHVRSLNRDLIDGTALQQLNSAAQTNCQQIPAGKKLGIAGVWVDLASTSDANTTEEDALSMVCDLTLSLLTARAGLTGPGFCFGPDQVELLVVTDLATFPTNARLYLEQAGFVVKDEMASEPVQLYRKWLEVNDPRDVNNAAHMLKLTPMWNTRYAAVVVADTDLFIRPYDAREGGPSADIFNLLLDPAMPNVFFHGAQNSPFNAGFIAASPTAIAEPALKLYMEAMSKGFSEPNGWGGTYDADWLALMQDASRLNIQSAGNRLDDQCGHNTAWCFIGRTQDQGMLTHMLASVDEDGHNLIPSFDFTNDLMRGDSPFERYIDHFTGPPKPWNIKQVTEESKGGNVNRETHQRLVKFWTDYHAHYSKAFDNVQHAACKDEYSTKERQSQELDRELRNELPIYEATRRKDELAASLPAVDEKLTSHAPTTDLHNQAEEEAVDEKLTSHGPTTDLHNQAEEEAVDEWANSNHQKQDKEEDTAHVQQADTTTKAAAKTAGAKVMKTAEAMDKQGQWPTTIPFLYL
jgi:hypothetical protein